MTNMNTQDQIEQYLYEIKDARTYIKETREEMENLADIIDNRLDDDFLAESIEDMKNLGAVIVERLMEITVAQNGLLDLGVER